jgi:hypothetical protein
MIRAEQPIDDDRTFDASGLNGINPDSLIVLLHFLTPSGNPLRPGYFKTLSARIAALCSALHVYPIGNHDLQSLAGAIGCTRSLISYYAVTLRDLGSLDYMGGRSNASREVYSKNARKIWSERGRVKATAKALALVETPPVLEGFHNIKPD